MLFSLLAFMLTKNFWFVLGLTTLSVALINFSNMKNHFMILLLMLELLSLLNLILWVFFIATTGLSMNSVFILMVMMVAEATISLALLVSISRSKAGELEVSLVCL